MNVNKKLDRFKQWAGERMGGEVKTNVSDDFKALETEMGLRQDGLEKIQKAMNGYVKAISKRAEVDSKEKPIPVAHLGAVMISHGEEFDPESDFGQALTTFGRTQERLARIQETYIAAATASWLESLERSTAQMKEYQGARKKLDTRRLAYDTSLAKMQKAKREDFRVEEELRSQRAKYEESEDDVHRRMVEIRESDPESVADLNSFLEAQLEYHDQCREALMRLKAEFPASSQPRGPSVRPGNRSRANTARSWANPYDQEEETPPPMPERPAIQSLRTNPRLTNPSAREYNSSPARPTIIRAVTHEPNISGSRKLSPPQMPRLPRVPSDSVVTRQQRPNLRMHDTQNYEGDVFGDDSTTHSSSSPDGQYNGYPISPATSHGSEAMTPITGKKAPPAPPSRLKKPPPPPPPAKRPMLHA